MPVAPAERLVEVGFVSEGILVLGFFLPIYNIYTGLEFNSVNYAQLHIKLDSSYSKMQTMKINCKCTIDFFPLIDSSTICVLTTVQSILINPSLHASDIFCVLCVSDPQLKGPMLEA